MAVEDAAALGDHAQRAQVAGVALGAQAFMLGGLQVNHAPAERDKRRQRERENEMLAPRRQATLRRTMGFSAFRHGFRLGDTFGYAPRLALAPQIEGDDFLRRGHF